MADFLTTSGTSYHIEDIIMNSKKELYGDELYEENVCHACGEYGETSMAKPLCYDCFKNS